MTARLVLPATLGALPTSGAGWNAVVAKSTTDPGDGNLALIDQPHAMAVLSIALRWARDTGGLGQTYVWNEIKAVMGTESGASQPLNPYRTLGGYVMAAVLTGMPGTTVGANGQSLDAWMQSWPGKVINGQSNWNTLEKCSRTSGNNWGACARASLFAVLLYLRARGLQPIGFDRETLIANLINWEKRYRGDKTVPNTFTATGAFQSAWAIESYPSVQGVTNKMVAGDFRSGANVEDASRSTYPTTTGSGQHYQWEAAESAFVFTILAINAGYSDAAGWGSSGLRNNFTYLEVNNLDVPSTDFHRFFWMIPTAANWLYPGLGLAIPPGWGGAGGTDRSQRRLLTTHTDWLTSTGSDWLKVAGDTGGGTTPTPTITNPTVAFTLATTGKAGTAVTLDAAGTTAGSAAIAYHDVDWGDGSAVQRLTEPTRSAPHTWANAGDYTVKVTAVATDGGTAGLSKPISIAPANGAPVAKIVADKLTGLVPLTVTFDMSGSFDPDGDPITGTVDYGDGIAEAITNLAVKFTHTYSTAVTQRTDRTVTARVTDTGGRVSDPAVLTITLVPELVDNTPGAWRAISSPLFLSIGGLKVPASIDYEGTWDGTHLAIGDLHIWEDPGGLLRYKPGPPNGPVDGVPLGSPSVRPLAVGATVPAGTPDGTLFVLHRPVTT